MQRHLVVAQTQAFDADLNLPSDVAAPAWRLKAIELPGPIDPAELIPSTHKLRFLQALSKGRWMNRPELTALAAPGTGKDEANALLKSLVKYGHIEVAEDQPTPGRHGRRPCVWHALPHGRRTVELIVPRATTVYRNALPGVRAARLMFLLGAFPQGLYKDQIDQILRLSNHSADLFKPLQYVCHNGYVERTTLGENVARGRTYRLTPEGFIWTQLLSELAASRSPVTQRTRRR